MISYLFKLASIYFLSMLKFIAGPTLGYAAGFSFLEILIVTICGMMTSVVLMTYLGEWIKNNIVSKYYKKKKIFTKKNRKIVKIWSKYGAMGIAALTPILLTPIGGTVIMTSFNVPKNIIFRYMLISGLIWGIIFTLGIDQIMELYNQIELLW
jgi:membrane protein DedA with SNARE-associated domain